MIRLPHTVPDGLFPDYRRAYEAALRAEFPAGVFRAELWMGQASGVGADPTRTGRLLTTA